MSTYLIVDGVSRVSLNSIKFGLRFGNDAKLANAFPTSIGGVIGKGFEVASGLRFDEVGKAELALGFMNDIVSIGAGGGNGGAIRALLQKPTNLGNISRVTKITGLSYDSLNGVHRTSRLFAPILNYQTLYYYGR